jgi:hypothetical protein
MTLIDIFKVKGNYSLFIKIKQKQIIDLNKKTQFSIISICFISKGKNVLLFA